MGNEITDERLIALLEGESNPALEKQVESDVQLKKRYDELKEVLVAISDSKEVEVPTFVKVGFASAIVNEQIKAGKRNTWPWMQIAASVALIILGFIAGKVTQPDNSAELSALMQEIQSLREVTLTSTLQKHSASERIMAVSQIEEKGESINWRLIETLISTLNGDESPNVRYAALQAIGKFIHQDEVRAELVKSLETQSDPLIQISLITILVEAEERSAIAPLKDIIDKEETTPEVKQQAEVALQVLT